MATIFSWAHQQNVSPYAPFVLPFYFVLATHSYLRDQSATALGATFDPELIEEVALRILSEEAKRKAASILLGPTCNIQRVSSVAP